MTNVLFVCLGNICRSPMAEAIFRHKISTLEDQFDTDSAGTSGWHIGEQPDPRTLDTLQSHGIEFSHFGRKAIAEDADRFDYILAMDQSNFQDLKAILPDEYNGLYLMRHFDPADKNADVPDPYYGGSDGFEQVFEILDRSIDNFLENVKNRNE